VRRNRLNDPDIDTRPGRTTTERYRGMALTAVCLLAATACGSSDDESAEPPPATATEEAVDDSETTEPSVAETTATTEAPAETTTSSAPPSTDAPETTDPGADEPPATAAPAEVPVLDFEFQPVPAGTYRVETIGAPFTIDVPDGWWVQPNQFGHFVLTDAESEGPGDRDIVMIRPSNLADPRSPGAPAEEQTGGWPLRDITGWIGALVPGVVDGEPTDTTIGGLDAVRFNVSITDDFECGEMFCAGFATNRLVNGMTFEQGLDYRVWWIDGGDEAPIAIDIGNGGDPAFIERAEAVLDTVTFDSIGPNPVPADGDLWAAGIPSDVPAGSVTLPVGPGVTFELSNPAFVIQQEYKARVLPDAPGEVDIFFPDLALDGESLATVDDVVGALERVPDFDATVAGTRDVGGFEATELTFTSTAEFSPDAPQTLQRSDSPDSGWWAAPEGSMWIMETDGGLVVVTGEWYEPEGMEPAQALADEILASFVIGS
jgi:hypothetical protein